MMPRLLPRRRLAGSLLCLVGATGLVGPAGGASPSRPDLVPVSVATAKRAQVAGGTFEVRITVRNSGRTSAKRSQVRFYLSRDRSRGRNDPRLEGKRTLQGLRAGARSSNRTRVRIPKRTRAGLYWVFACADATRLVRESREGNNCRRTSPRIRVTAGAPVVAAAGDVACDPEDSGYNGGRGTSSRCHQMQVSNLLAGSDRVLALGDLQYENATLAKFNQVYDKSWGRFKSLTSSVIGNHEYDFDTANTAKGYFDYFNGVGRFSGPAGDRDKGYYSYNLGSWHIVVLNSNCGRGRVRCEAGSAQEKWLRADLAANPARCTLASWHHPLFTSTPDSSSGSAYATPAVAPLWKALRENGADVLLTGHAHNYERFARLTETGAADPNGVRQFISGAGGKSHYGFADRARPFSQFRDMDNFGVLKLTLKPGRYDWGFQTESKTVLDPGSEACV